MADDGPAEGGADAYLHQVKGRQGASDDRCHRRTRPSEQQHVPGPRPQSIKQSFEGLARVTLEEKRLKGSCRG